MVVNASYFSPYSFKLFSVVDKQHDWQALADSSYTLLDKLSTSKLDQAAPSDGLPPNWVLMNRSNGTLARSTDPNLDTNYGYDAMRLPFRLALDYQWFKDPRDKQLLKKYEFLGKQWRDKGELASIYSHAGEIVGDYESPAMYGSALGYFKINEPKEAQNFYTQKLQTLYNPDTQNWQKPLSYYDDNWAWFGMALYLNALPNLATINN